MLTYKEALEILQEERDWAQQPQYVNCALSIARKAIKKQIPERSEKIDVQGYMRKHWNPRCCPVCKIEKRGKPNYCSNCGQALGWSD